MFSIDFVHSVVKILQAGQQFILGTKHFVKTGCSVSHSKHTSRSRMGEAMVEQVRDSFVQSPRKSMRHTSRETVWHILEAFAFETIPIGRITAAAVQGVLCCEEQRSHILKIVVPNSLIYCCIIDEGNKVGLKINENKFKYMIGTRDNDRWKNLDNIQIGTHSFQRTNRLKYLGSIITENGTSL
ncbi:hypothetical protein C0J52_15850 [Blattella germanica]|nr:hypothetical protein C0J52_15850 [Blattella germanica]